MRWLSFLAVLLASLPAAAQSRPVVYVEITDATSAEASPIAEGVAHVLVSAGMPVTVGHVGGADCGNRCVRVTLRRAGAEGFSIEARYLGKVSSTTVRLPASTSFFDQTHALAIDVELLVDDALGGAHADRRAPVAAASPPRAPREPTAPAPAPPAVPSPVMASPPASPPPETRVATAAPPPAEVIAVVPLPAQVVVVTAAPPPVRPERVAFQVDATAIGGLSEGLFTAGVSVAAKIPLGPLVDLRFRGAILNEEHIRTGGMKFSRRVFPISLYATVGVPSMPRFRAGVGAELVAMHGDAFGPSDQDTNSWSSGVLGMAEYRWPMRSFQLRSALQVAYHPFDDRLESAGVELLEFPTWTVGASVGFEFRLW